LPHIFEGGIALISLPRNTEEVPISCGFLADLVGRKYAVALQIDDLLIAKNGICCIVAACVCAR
jgi:hypothetical protein